MTRQQAIAAAPQTRKAYWANIAFYTTIAAFVGFLSVKIPRWEEIRPPVWPLYLLSLLSILTLLQSIERLIFPLRTAIRSRALNIKVGSRVSGISRRVSLAMFVAAIFFLTYHLITRHGPPPPIAQALITSGFLVTAFTHDLLGHKFEDSDDYEHSPPLTGLKPLQSERWGAAHTS
jgi:hypothetical protein